MFFSPSLRFSPLLSAVYQCDGCLSSLSWSWLSIVKEAPGCLRHPTSTFQRSKTQASEANRSLFIRSAFMTTLTTYKQHVMLHIPNIEITLYVDNTTNHKCFTQWWDWERFAHNNKLSLIIKSTAKKNIN